MPDDEERLPFVSALATEVDTPASHDAFVYASAAAASIKLVLGDFAGARAELDKCEEILDALDAVETVVHASFYRVNGDYYKVR